MSDQHTNPKSDIEIAQAAHMRPIMDVAAVDKLLKPELYVETGLKI